MANEDIKLIRLQLTLAELTTDDGVLSNGQQVFVTGITDAINIVSKFGDGTSKFSELSFFDTIKIETGSNYDVTQAFLAVDGNEVEITATADIVVTTDGDPIDVISGQTIRLRRISASWVTLAAGGAGAQVAGTLGETISANTLVYFDTTGKLAIGDNSDLTKAILAGFLVKSGVLNDNRLVQSGGIMDGFTGLTTGTQYFLGASGGLVVKGDINYNEYIVSVGVAVSATEIDVAIRVPEPNRSYDNGLSIGAMIEFATYKDRTAEGLIAFDYDNAISQANYHILFSEIGHKWNDAHVAAGDTDLSASTTLFYPTPPPDFYNRIAIPDISISSTDVADDGGGKIIINHHITALLGNNAGRTGTPLKFYPTSGSTLPTGIVEGTVYYAMFDATTTYLQLSTAENYAIGGTNRINYTDSGSGSFYISQEGIVIDDALQSFELNLKTPGGAYVKDGTYGASGGIIITTGGAKDDTVDWKAKEFNSDGLNGTPRTTNETRPKTVMTFKYVKAEYVTTAGEPISALRYDTGWVANSDWTATTFSVTHNLGADMVDLSVTLFVSPSGSDSDAFSFGDVTRVYDQGATLDNKVGYSLFNVDSNSLKIVTGADGIYYFDASNTLQLLDTEAWYYKVVVTKPNLVSTVFDTTQMPTEYDIATVNKTVTLPLLTGVLQTRECSWINGDGTAKIQFSVPDNTDTYSTSVYEGEGEGHIKFEAVNGVSGLMWKVVEYEDSYVNGVSEWYKYIDKTMRQSKSFDIPSGLAVTTARTGGGYRSSGPDQTLPKSFIDTDYKVLAQADGYFINTTKPNTSSAFYFGIAAISSHTTTGDLPCRYTALGKWA